jgi:pyruvate dehydrogenase E2 component (dihydrolipoamide acetyltransferase)
MAKAAGLAIVAEPAINSILRFNRIYRRKKIGVFFQVAMKEPDGKIDLSGATLYDVEQKDLLTIVREFEEKVTLVRNRQDPNLEKTRGIFKHVPYLFLNRFLSFIGFLGYTLNLKLPGTARDPFGSMLITNIGSLGIDQAFVPLVPYSRVPIVLAVGAVRKVPVVEGDDIVIRRVMKVNATFDHRFIDGVHVSKMAEVFRNSFADPETYFGEIPQSLPESEEA